MYVLCTCVLTWEKFLSKRTDFHAHVPIRACSEDSRASTYQQQCGAIEPSLQGKFCPLCSCFLQRTSVKVDLTFSG